MKGVRKLFVSVFAVLSAITVAYSQNDTRITGVVVDETAAPVIQAGVQVLAAADSTMIEGLVTDTDGRFAVKVAPGDYILRISFIGYQTRCVNVHQTSSQSGIELGTVALSPATLMLERSVVAAKVEPVVIKEDTVVYNAAAYRLADDAMLEDLLRKIPGLEIDKSNNVTLYGREIKQLLVNGKKYFGGDVKTGLKNLSASMIDNVRAYDRESDFTRLTGIEDGEEEPVLDLSIKKNMMKGFHGNVNLGYGTEDRYAARTNINKITKHDQITVLGNIRNTPTKADISNTSRSQLGNGSNGNATRSEAGATFARDRDTLDLGGHVHFSGTDRAASGRSRSQSILATSQSFSNSNSSVTSLADVFKGDFTLEWKPTQQWTIYFKPVFNFDMNDTYSHSLGSSFNSDPYEVVSDPNQYVDQFDMDPDPLRSIRVNNSNNAYQSATRKFSTDITASITRRSAIKKGRTITFRAKWNAYWNSVDQASKYQTRYYRIKKNPDSLLVRSNYMDQDNSFNMGQLTAAWNEPFAKGWYLQLTYSPEIRYQEQTKNYYLFQTTHPEWGVPETRGLKNIISSLPEDYEASFYNLFSGAGQYTYFGHNIQISVRYIYKKKLNMTVGVNLKPQTSTLTYLDDNKERQRVDISLFNAAPTVSLRYNKTKNQRLMLTYRSWTNSPTMTNLVPITNGSNPLYVSKGNPYLLPAYQHNIRAEYNSSNLKKQNSFVCNLNAFFTQNATSTSTEYIEETGGRISTPKNIDGNWRVSGSMAYNKTLPNNHFSVNDHLSAEYQNNVSYLYNSSKAVRADEINTVTRLMAKERFEACYRNDWLEILSFGGIEYTNEASLLRPEMTQNPLCTSTGVSTIINFPWKMRFETDWSILFQRNFSYDELNRNYQVWNAELSQTVLKGKGTIRIGWYDILNDQDNLIRSFSSSSRSISMYNGITSYVMLRFLYRFKIG